MDDFDVMLDHVTELRDRNKDKELYNVFHSLGFRSQETMHSKFISTLLNPKDQHGMNGDFLKLFLKQINLDFNINNVKISTEKSADKRRIDIGIENNDSIIIIENKIFAQDQDRQLEDYYKTSKKAFKNVDMIYLTPYGTLPSDKSLGETPLTVKNKVKCISYEKVIIPWIDECAKRSDGRLKASLEMYSELLSELINRDKNMEQIFDYLKKDKEKLKAAFDINSALQGRNYIKEFPESKDYLMSRICAILGNDANPYLEENDTIMTITDTPEVGFAGWRIYFEDGEIYVTNDNDKYIKLFQPSDINDKNLRSLIFEENEIADEWLIELFNQIRNN